MNWKYFNVMEYIQSLNIEYDHERGRSTRGWINIDCVFCGDGIRGKSLGINLEHNNMSCWRCSASGSVSKLVREIENPGSVKKVFEDHKSLRPAGVHSHREITQREKTILPEGVLDEPLDTHYNYLLKRKFSPEYLIMRYQIKFTSYIGDYKHKIIIPVFYQNELHNFTALDITGKALSRYKSNRKDLSKTPLDELVYGLDEVDLVACVVEGPTDKWRVGDFAIATFGMDVTKGQLDKMVQSSVHKFFILFDGEPQAQINANKLAKELTMAGKEVEVLELDSGDPDKMSQEDLIEVKTLLRNEYKRLKDEKGFT